MIHFLILLIILYFLYTIVISNEYFTIVGSNNSSVPNYKIIDSYEQHTITLKNELKTFTHHNDFNTTDFILYNSQIPFPFTKSFHTLILSFLTKLNSLSNNKKLYFSNLNNIYYKNIDNSRIFIFNIFLKDYTNLILRNLKVKILVPNITQYLDNTGNYIFDESNSNASILSVIVDNDVEFTFKGTDELQPNLYLI